MNIKIYADNLEKSVAEQIEHIKQSKLFDFPKTVVRIMPDTHFGMGAVIGFTSKGNKILIPDFIGVDIGCGVLATEIKNFKPEFELIDKTIKETVPMGFTSHTDKNIIANYQNILDTTINSKKIISCLVPSASQIGTLGGGNHFMSIEIVDGKTYFIVHSGSRNFGLKVCEFWQKQAEIDCAELIECGIISKDLAYLKDKHRDGYINDMVIAQQYASLNRQQIVSQVFTALGWEQGEVIESVHNYFNQQDDIVRKGAIELKEDQKAIIPINMRDGTFFVIGNNKGYDWNWSAPHGAGRVMSRTEAKTKHDYHEYQEVMKDSGVYSSVINSSTLDEAPFCYKTGEYLKKWLEQRCKEIKQSKVVYNIKAQEETKRR